MDHSGKACLGTAGFLGPMLSVLASRMCALQGASEVMDWRGWSVTQDYRREESRSLGSQVGGRIWDELERVSLDGESW